MCSYAIFLVVRRGERYSLRMDKSLIDIAWVILCALLVFFMQPGFLCLEAGLTRTKNAINVAIKNISDFGLSSLIFWVVGFGVMFGEGWSGLVGTSYFWPEFRDDSLWGISFFLFQLMFCGTAVTLISGAVAERISFISYLLITCVISALLYPLFGHWVWGGALTGTPGWLASLGFIDFAGASVVHGVGGWAALAVILIIGPRTGRFEDGGHRLSAFSGSHLPMAMTGIFLLWVGWIGFNGGSAFGLTARTPLIIVNTILAGSAGMIVAGAAGYIWYGYPKIITIMNGSLAGLVSITACCFAVTPGASVVIGGIGGLIMVFGTLMLERLKIDDVIGAVPVHLMAGIWGTLAVALFADLSVLGTGLSRLEQLLAQFYGIGSCFLVGFCGTYAIFGPLDRVRPLRVSREAEIKGLNIVENREVSELYDLMTVMHEQERTQDLSLRAPVDPYTEIGQIAAQYNQLMDSLQSSLTHISNLQHSELSLKQKVIAEERAKAEILSYQKRLNSILDNAVDGLITIDSNGIVESYNKACEQMFGYSAKEVIGQNIKMLMPERYAANHDGYIRHYLETGEGKIIGRGCQLEGRRKDGHIFPIDLSVSEIRLGSERIFSGIIRDITEQKEAEAELLRSNSALELFASIASHDLRAPLGYIAMCASLLKEGYESKLDEEGREFLNVMSKSATSMQDMIKNLLEYSRIGAHKQNFKPVDLSESVDGALEKLTVEIRDSHAHISCGDLPVVMGNSALLTQLFQNLIGNAVKYRKKSESPRVAITCREEAGEYMIAVSDNGIGIDPKFKEKIFLIFQRLHTDDEYKGSGVGLSFCQRIVEFHGGKIWLDTEYEGGSRLCFSLPVPPSLPPLP